MKKIMKTRSLCACLLTILLLFACPLSVYADSLPEPSTQFYVLDEAGVLGSAAEAKIVSENQALFALTGAEIAVVCVDTTGSMDIADYAYELFNKWGIGSSQRNNGVLILLSIDEDDYWVLQGEGLETTLTSGMLKLMNNDYLEPHFAKKQYEDGVLALFDAIVAHFETLYSIDIESWDGAPGEFTPRDAAVDDGEDRGGSSAASIFMTLLVIALVILFIIIILNNHGGGNGGGRRYYGPTVHVPLIIRPPRGGFFPGGVHPPRGGSFGGGFGGFSGGGSRGGFSGGGGGHSRGGGAGRR